jgi:hypothetical protein
VLLVCTPSFVWIPLLLRLDELSFHFIISFLNLMVFIPSAHICCLFFASVFFIQLIRSWCLLLTRSMRPHLPSRSPWFLSGSVSTSVWSFLFIGQVAPLFVSSLGFLSISYLQLSSEGVRGNHSGSFVFIYVNCFDNGFFFGTIYRCLTSNSGFYRGFGCDCVSDSLFLQFNKLIFSLFVLL